MAHSVCEVLLTEQPLSAPPLHELEETGAVLDFWGVVRATENGRNISGIVYEAHGAMAEHQLLILAREAAKQFDLGTIIIWHRIGFVAVGEPSLLVRVGTGHRVEAFHASQWTVDELKKRIPIWKRPEFEKGIPATEREASPQSPTVLPLPR